MNTIKKSTLLALAFVLATISVWSAVAPDRTQAASSTVVTLDTADSLNGWGSSNPLSLDTADKKEGAASISMTGSQVVQFAKSFSTPVNTQMTMQSGTLNFWYYVDDVSNLDGSIGQVEITSSGGPDVNEVDWDFASRLKPQLNNGWNFVTLRLDQASTVMGSPDLSAINFFRIYFFNSKSAVVKLDNIFFEQTNPNAVVLDKAESLQGWSSSNLLTLDSAEKAEGMASISMTGSEAVEFEKTFSAPFNSLASVDTGTLNFFYFIDDINKVNGASGSVELSSAGSPNTDSYQWDLTGVLPQLASGWNLVKLKLTDAVAAGNPDLSAINYFRISVNKAVPVTAKLDTIYFEEQQGLPTQDYVGTSNAVLTLNVTNGSEPGNKYVYRKVAMPDYKFQPGDYIEYDVMIDYAVDGAGGIELSVLEGGNFRETGWTDQNGILGHGEADISAHALNQWYHRKMKVPQSMIGKHLDQFLIVGENNTAGLNYSAQYKNVVITDRLGNLHKSIYTASSDYSLVGVAYSNGVISSAVLGGPATNKPHAKVYKPDYPSQDVVIASFKVTDDKYGADMTGVQDATSAFQQALNDCAVAGGGVVWAPAGKYKLLGSLQVGNSCTLRGDWKKPTDSNLTVGGTILLAYPGRGDEHARAFISLGTAAGVRNLSIYYPEQTIGNVKPYPYTIAQATPSSGTVMNMTLVNSYNGISVAKQNNGLHYTRDVYGTPLKTGIFLELVFDVGRIEEVQFSPKYWAGSGLPGSPSISAISNYTQGDHGTAGIVIGRDDWEVLNGITIENYATGIKFVDSNGLSNGTIYNMTVKGARTGIAADVISSIGWLVAASSIEATVGPDPVAVLAPAGFKHTSLQFNKTTFSGTGTAVKQVGNGLLSFVNSSFLSWNLNGYAIDAQQGSVLVEGSTFAAASNGAKHIHLGTSLSSASILSNNYNGSAAIDNDNPANSQVIIDQAPRTFESISGAPYVRAVHPKPANTGQGDLYDVSKGKYNAAADGVTDDTAAIQEALDDAGRKGGGTVYLPAGEYRVNGHLNVPAGVELRGAQDVPFHTMSHGTVLYAYVNGDKGNSSGTPFIKLNSSPSVGGSGIRGILIWYPEQSVDNVTPFPWAIQSQGPNCWVIYTNVSNAYQGVDFGTYNNNGHVIDYLSGAGLKTGLFVGNTSTEGWVENVHFNPTYWSGAGSLINSPGGEATLTKIWPWQKANGTGFLFGRVAHGHVSETFVFGAHDGVQFIEQPGIGSFHGDVINHGTDGAMYGARFSSVDEQGVNFINLEAVQFDDGQFIAVDNTISPTAPIRFFNTNHWTGPTVGYDIQGGKVLLQQVHFTEGGTNAVKVTAGTVDIQASYFAVPMPQLINNVSGTVSVTGSATAGGLTFAGTVQQDGNVSR